MSKNKGTSVREAKVAKAGKRSGGYVEPPAINKDKQDRQFLGEQQFYSPKQQSIKVTRDNWIVWDKPSKSFVYRPKTEVIEVEFTLDESRKRVIVSPNIKDKGK